MWSWFLWGYFMGCSFTVCITVIAEGVLFIETLRGRSSPILDQFPPGETLLPFP